MKVVLFDIDGTLISSRGVGKRAMEASLVEHFGTSGPEGYRYDGKTDRQIVRELMRAAGFGDDVIDERMPAVIERYLERLRMECGATPDIVTLLAGVHALIDALETRADVTLGLLTGNVMQGARIKMEATRLGMARFRLGAYGSDHERRDELPAIAKARACELLARDIAGDALVIIGDTPSDVTCGRAVGARAIGVATGHYSVDALREYSPSAAFADLSDTSRVVEAIIRA